MKGSVVWYCEKCSAGDEADAAMGQLIHVHLLCVAVALPGNKRTQDPD